MLYPDVPDETIELEGEGEDVVVVRRVPHDEGPIRFIRQDLFCRLPADGTPVPPALQRKTCSVFICHQHHPHYNRIQMCADYLKPITLTAMEECTVSICIEHHPHRKMYSIYLTRTPSTLHWKNMSEKHTTHTAKGIYRSFAKRAS